LIHHPAAKTVLLTLANCRVLKMKLIANGLNKQFFRSLLPPSGTELDGVFAAIAYGDDRTDLLQHCKRSGISPC